MKKIYLVDGVPYEVVPSKEQQFLEDFKDKNPILQDDELGKSKGASQPQNNQQNRFLHGKAFLVSNSENSLSESQKKDESNREGYTDFSELPKYNSSKAKSNLGIKSLTICCSVTAFLSLNNSVSNIVLPKFFNDCTPFPCSPK